MRCPALYIPRRNPQSALIWGPLQKW
eukprot:COSAG01_NODE_47434_length_390_cov_0.931271_1_plen_25_part_10